MKPLVQISEFQKLELRTGTVTAVRRLTGLEGLAILTVCLPDPVQVLAPGSSANGLTAGSRVVVAAGLHPLQAGGQGFTACLVAGPLANDVSDGSRLS